MRLLISSFIFVVSSLVSFAETPEIIYPKTKIIKPVDWYARQSALWKERTMQVSSDAPAWLNYFIAAKYSSASQNELELIAARTLTSIPNTFEYHLIQGLLHPYSAKSFEHLLQAYKLNPGNASTYAELLQMNEFIRNEVARKEFSEKLFHASLVSPSLLNYSYNVLMSLEKDAVLFTDSDNTTLPIFLLQDVLGTRKDVTVLNLDMLAMEEYRDAKLSSTGLALTDYVSSSKQELCALLPEQNPGRTFYYALTLSKDNIVSIKDQLYVVGLASQLSAKRVDNITAIRNNLENRFLLDYLTVDFNGENEYAAGKVLNANYLVPMLLLLEHYRAVKDEVKARELEEQIMQLAKASGKTLLVENFLKGKVAEDLPFVPYKIEPRELEGYFKQVKENVYAHEYEVTNKMYNEFLQYLKDNSRTDLLEICKIQLSQYEEPALSFMKGYHLNRQPTKKEKYFLMYPVINISYDAAQEYCKWLTEQYNNTTERKYKKVKFRLPSIAEWQLAAAGIKNPTSWKLEENTVEVKLFEGGKEAGRKYETKSVSMADREILYPWFRHWTLRNQPLNTRGCSLGNFKYPESQQSCLPNKMNSADGFLLMSPVQAYFPNEIGLYDVVGNVAEMTNENGRACGGSWNHSPEESTIRSVNQYAGPNSETGFRIFMEVLEQ